MSTIMLGRMAAVLALCGCFASPLRAEWAGNADGTVFDTATGLTWMRCAVGQTWSGTTCSGTASHHTWAQAMALTSTHAGFGDWRLPNIRELQSIINYWNASPAIESAAAFPATPSTAFWSATGSQWNVVSDAWYVDFNDGDTGFASKTQAGVGYTWAARLVRGGVSSALLNPARPDSDYADFGAGMVKHLPSGLIWQRCAKGQVWTGSLCDGTALTYTHAQAWALTDTLGGYNDWRLPTPEELLSLADYQLRSPAINSAWFPNLQIAGSMSAFWTSMRYRSPFTGQSWAVNFIAGASGGGSDESAGTYQVRLVRKDPVQPYSTLNVTRSGNGFGTVSSSPWGIDCGVACSGEFLADTWTMLLPAAASGSYFAGWSGDCNGAGSCVLEMNATRNVDVVFSLNGSPSAPTIASARIGPGSVSLTFSAPANNGGSAITRYNASCASSGHATMTATGTTSPITVRKLSGGVPYTCSLSATNASGTSPTAVWPGMLTPRRPGIASILMLLLD